MRNLEKNNVDQSHVVWTQERFSPATVLFRVCFFGRNRDKIKEYSDGTYHSNRQEIKRKHFFVITTFDGMKRYDIFRARPLAVTC